MLETKNLCKVYKPKKGVPVQALDNVSLKFPDKGMVFLLGKSGSGKSTLLNLLGGLDKYTSGEITIKGVSSKNFKQSYFDSYRNTYVGFIFQEYNILEEFSVGANIALAIELQGRKASDDEINRILKEVDLEGYGNRKPNELSGGQKQRVAIARALIKNPEIIMADEPTGALDSNTGKQVFDTLKKLSKDKLVIIVSHDREFSEQYADRIIELSDGKVVSDVEHIAGGVELVEEVKEGINFNGNIVEINRGYHLTEEDRLEINAYIDKIASGEVSIQVKTKNSKSGEFVNTDQSKIVHDDTKPFKLIKSKLPFKNAFKIGASGLRYKKVKLVFTVILSVVAFGLFGLADTFAAYNHIKTSVDSIIDTDVEYVSLSKSVLVEDYFSYWDNYYKRISSEELEKISEETGIEYIGVVTPEYMDFYFMGNFDTEKTMGESGMSIYAESFSGFAEIDKELLEAMNYEILEGELPDGSKKEMAISKYVFETFKKAGYCKYVEANGEEERQYREIEDYDDIIGRTITFNGDEEYKVTAVIDTHVDFDRYATLMESTVGQSVMDELLNYALMNEFGYVRDYSLASAIMVGEGHLDEIIEELPHNIHIEGYIDLYNDEISMGSDLIADFNEFKDSDVKVNWIGEAKDSLGDKEIIVSTQAVYNIMVDSMSGEDEDIYESLGNQDFEMFAYAQGVENETGWKVVGWFDTYEGENYKWGNTIVMSHNTFENFSGNCEFGEYDYVIGAMPSEREDITELVEYCNREDVKVRYEMQNAVTYELSAIHEVLKVLSTIFVSIGIGFAIFAALLLANFIANSISYKKQEIGILRAIGSRSNDVFAIFFSESLIIAITNFVISTVGVAVVTAVINIVMRKSGILVTVLHFGIRQVALLLVISVGIAALASFIPVKKIASKKPIDAIRNR